MDSPKKKNRITNVDETSEKSNDDLLKLCKPLSVTITRLPNWVVNIYGPQSLKNKHRGGKLRWKHGFTDKSQRKRDLRARRRKLLRLAMAHAQFITKPKKKKQNEMSNPKQETDKQIFDSNVPDQGPSVLEKIDEILDGSSEEVKSKSTKKREDETSNPKQISDDRSLNSNVPDQEPPAPEKIDKISDPRSQESNTDVAGLSELNIDSQEKKNTAIVEAAAEHVDDDDCLSRKLSLRKRKRQSQTLPHDPKKHKTAGDGSAPHTDEISLPAEVASSEIVTPRTRPRKIIRRQINALVVLNRLEDSRDPSVVQWRDKTKLTISSAADAAGSPATDRIEEEPRLSAAEESPLDAPIASENDDLDEESRHSTVTYYESSTGYEVSSTAYTTETEDNDEEIMGFLHSRRNIGPIANDFGSSSSDGTPTVEEARKTPMLRRSTRTQRLIYSHSDSASDAEQQVETTPATSDRVLRSRAKTPSTKRPETRMSRRLRLANTPAIDGENSELEKTSTMESIVGIPAVAVACEEKSSNRLVTNDSSSDEKCYSGVALKNVLDVGPPNPIPNPTYDEDEAEPENSIDRVDCNSSEIDTDSEALPINDASSSSSSHRNQALIARQKLTALNAMVVLTRLEDFDDISESNSTADSGMDFRVAEDWTTGRGSSSGGSEGADPLEIQTVVDNPKVEGTLDSDTGWSQDTAESDVELTLVLEEAEKTSVDEAAESICTPDEGILTDANSKNNSPIVNDKHRKSLSKDSRNTSPEKRKSLGESTSINHQEATTDTQNKDYSSSAKSPANKSTPNPKKSGKKTPKRKTRPHVDHPICNVCSVNFVTTQALSKHIYTHSPEELQEAFRVQKAKLIADSQAARNVVASENTDAIPQKAVEISSGKVDVEEANSGEKLGVPRSVVAAIDDDANSSTIATAVCPCHKDDNANVEENELQIEMALVCQYCQVLFRRRECFEVHYRTSPRCANDRTQGRWPKLFCANCQLTLDDWVSMRHHLEIHASENAEGTVRFVCNICRVVFVGFGALFYSHWVSHLKDTMFVASRYTFPKISVQPIDGQAKLPIGASADETYIWVAEHVCAECKKSFSTRRDLVLHQETCGNNKQLSTGVTTGKDPPNDDQSLWYCDACELPFANRHKLNEHGASSHDRHWTCVSTSPQQKTFMCTQCYAMRKRIKDIEDHWKTHPQHNSCQVDKVTNAKTTDDATRGNKTVFQTSAESDSPTGTTCTEENQKSSMVEKEAETPTTTKSPQKLKTRIRALEDPCVNIVMSDSSGTDRGSASLVIDESSSKRTDKTIGKKSNRAESYQILMMDNNPGSTSGPIKMVLGRKSAGKATTADNAKTTSNDAGKATTAGYPKTTSNAAGKATTAGNAKTTSNATDKASNEGKTTESGDTKKTTEDNNSVNLSLAALLSGQSEAPDIIEIIEEIEVPMEKSSPNKFDRSPRKKLANIEKTGNNDRSSKPGVIQLHSSAAGSPKNVGATRNKSLQSSPSSGSDMKSNTTDNSDGTDNNTPTRREPELSFEEVRYKALSLSKKLVQDGVTNGPVESKKPLGFLRVKNLSELQEVREHVCAICNANLESLAALDKHSQLHLQNSFGKRGKFSKGMTAALALPDSSERPTTPIAIAPKPNLLAQALTQPYVPQRIAVLSRSTGGPVNWINVDNKNKSLQPIAAKTYSSPYKFKGNATKSVITSTASVAQNQLNSGPVGYITIPDKNRVTTGYHFLPAMVVPSAQNNRQQYVTVAPQQNSSSKNLPMMKNTDYHQQQQQLQQPGSFNKIVCTICTTFQCDTIEAFNEHITKHFVGFNKPNVALNNGTQSAVLPTVLLPQASAFATVNNEAANVVPDNAAKGASNDRLIVNNWILPNTPVGCTTSTFTQQTPSSGLPITSQSVLSTTVAGNSNGNETSVVTMIKQSVSSLPIPQNSNNATNISKQPAGWPASTFNNGDDVPGGIAAYRCMICKSVMYRDYEHVRRHILNVHESFLKCRIENIIEKNYCCTRCPNGVQPYDSPAKLKIHQTTVHSKTCPSCNSVFHNHVTLLDHIANCCSSNSHGNCDDGRP